MGQRLDLSRILQEIIGSDQVHFQPPSNINMVYPAIVYDFADADTKHANNLVYGRTRKYEVTLITRDADDPAEDKIAHLPMTSRSRAYKADGLTHYPFEIYY